MRVAGAKFPMPKVFGDPIEAEKRMIRGPALFLGIVTDPGHFLSAVKGQDCGVPDRKLPWWGDKAFASSRKEGAREAFSVWGEPKGPFEGGNVLRSLGWDMRVIL